MEVKYWPEIDFQSLEDVPYPNIIVDEAYKIAKFPKPTLYGYVILNASKTGCLLIRSVTRSKWFDKKVFDKKEGDNRVFCFCPKEYVSYKPMI